MELGAFPAIVTGDRAPSGEINGEPGGDELERREPKDFSISPVSGALAGLFPDAVMLTGPSSQSIWRSPDLKRQLWRALSELTSL